MASCSFKMSRLSALIWYIVVLVTLLVWVPLKLGYFLPHCCSTSSNAVLLLWIIYVISVLFCYAFMHAPLLVPCGHLLGKGWSLGSRLWCLIVTLSLSHWYPGSGVVLDCIDSWSLPPFLLRSTTFVEVNFEMIKWLIHLIWLMISYRH